ncbi:PepSY domain-containing protein [Catenovulum sp. SM1970]|uniref:PepSY-associated TM helix domain-containing protein n=1 Tax=Marinifaba aquimaris TaxID=2741323 RepID=UPI001572C8AA|nr:PepSY-associated TM helix domain-containing protein [Marinifaba aquimaris]NTS76669.1 PepSY domain-containing protein [Marinifaba aquimaris]
MSFYRTNRFIHKWISIAIALPLLLVLVTGILLLVKKQFDFIQPATAKGQFKQPSLSFEQILTTAQSIEIAEIDSWQDVDRLDVRPNKGVIKIRSNNSVEIQIDATTNQVLNVAPRRSDFIESLHDATFFQRSANLWLMLPVAFLSLVLLVTGIIVFLQPYLKKKR